MLEDLQKASIFYLEDEELEIEIAEDLKIKLFGTPWTAEHGNAGKAFQIPRGDLPEKWEKIPGDVDVLISHSPPYSVHDRDGEGNNAGCKALLELVSETIRPRVHVFGHIHEGYGWTTIGRDILCSE